MIREKQIVIDEIDRKTSLITDTANQISIRCNKPLPAVLNMQLGIHRSIRRGSIPHLVCTKDISSYKICENDRI